MQQMITCFLGILTTYVTLRESQFASKYILMAKWYLLQVQISVRCKDVTMAVESWPCLIYAFNVLKKCS